MQMRNVAIVLAGGIGSRMQADIPKQFLVLKDKPIIVHTIINFERNASIDSILVVCEKDWLTHMEKLIKDYNLCKVKWIVPGGATCHDSTRNGIFFLKRILSKSDFVVIHDGVRPILPQEAINIMLEMAWERGNASLAIPCHETVIYTDDQLSGNKQVDRKHLMLVQTPQAYRYEQILNIYESAEREGKHDFGYADLVCVHYGERIFFSKGFINNIKITEKDDLPFCESLMNFDDKDLFK